MYCTCYAHKSTRVYIGYRHTPRRIEPAALYPAGNFVQLLKLPDPEDEATGINENVCTSQDGVVSEKTNLRRRYYL